MQRRQFLAAISGVCAFTALPAAAEDMRKAMIIRARCVGCGDCVRSCPVEAITLDNGKAVIDQASCVGCRRCVLTCSYGAPRL